MKKNSLHSMNKCNDKTIYDLLPITQYVKKQIIQIIFEKYTIFLSTYNGVRNRDVVTGRSMGF